MVKRDIKCLRALGLTRLRQIGSARISSMPPRTGNLHAAAGNIHSSSKPSQCSAQQLRLKDKLAGKPGVIADVAAIRIPRIQKQIVLFTMVVKADI